MHRRRAWLRFIRGYISMKIIEPSIELLDDVDGEQLLRKLERAGRVCYKSEGKMGEGTSATFIKGIVARGHESVIEHEKITVLVTCDRGVTHEIVRHRIASYSQESTRYCNYTGDKFGNEITFIKPCFWEEDSPQFNSWRECMQQIEQAYFTLIEQGARPEQARSILPNSLKAEIVVTMNIRSWRNFLKLRTEAGAHPQIRQVAGMILAEFKARVPYLFDDITPASR